MLDITSWSYPPFTFVFIPSYPHTSKKTSASELATALASVPNRNRSLLKHVKTPEEIYNLYEVAGFANIHSLSTHVHHGCCRCSIQLSDLIKYRLQVNQVTTNCGQMQHGVTIMGHNQPSYAVLQQVCGSLVSRKIILILIHCVDTSSMLQRMISWVGIKWIHKVFSFKLILPI